MPIFGIVCFLSTRNPWRHNRLIWRPCKKDVSLLTMCALCQPGFDDVTIIFCVGRAGNMSRVSNVCFLPTRNRWRYNNFLWMPSRKYTFRLTMFAFLWKRNVWPHNNFLLRLSRKDVSRLVMFAIFSTKNRWLHNNFCVHAEQEWCLAFDNVFFISYRNLWRHNRFLSMTTRRYVFPLAIFAFCRPEIYYVTICSL